jgi:hypothetical protein
MAWARVPKMLRLAFRTILLALIASTQAQQSTFSTLANSTFPLTLAVQPACGAFSSVNYTDANAGVMLTATKTIVAFGDSWTSNGGECASLLSPVPF